MAEGLKHHSLWHRHRNTIHKALIGRRLMSPAMSRKAGSAHGLQPKMAIGQLKTGAMPQPTVRMAFGQKTTTFAPNSILRQGMTLKASIRSKRFRAGYAETVPNQINVVFRSV
ncbi:hypothetical protein CGZ80_01450 [Rhodopirellula sp. MGV]|nr:hypothetical protein CGZ80_01450 [Rhodopirellula sp. MGV]